VSVFLLLETIDGDVLYWHNVCYFVRFSATAATLTAIAMQLSEYMDINFFYQNGTKSRSLAKKCKNRFRHITARGETRCARQHLF